MRIAYIISAYKLPNLLVRLVNRLNSPDAMFLVHVDRKTSPAVYEGMVAPLRTLDNVHFLQRHVCHWGDFGHVRATLKGIDALVDRRHPFDYAILLTGQHYPIKSHEQITEFLQQARQRLFLSHFPLPSDEWDDGGLDRITRWNFHLRGRRLSFAPPHGSILQRRFPRGLRPFGGSSYWCLPAAAISYIYGLVRSDRSLVRFFKYVEVPDEIFFQTIVANSPYAHDVVNDDLNYVDWKDPVAASPAVLARADFERLAASPKLFARKFDPNVDTEILDMIDQRLLTATGSAV